MAILAFKLIRHGHPGGCIRPDSIAGHAVPGHILCYRPGETDDALFGGAIVGLAEIAEARDRCRIDDAAPIAAGAYRR